MYTYSCTVLNVVDGDTLDVVLDLGFEIRVTERVRLLGVDTPEVFGSKAVPAGITASDFTKKFVADRKDGSWVYESKHYNARDKYGRSLGILSWKSADGKVTEELNNALLKSGNAKVLKG